MLSKAKAGDIFGAPLLVASASSLGTAALFFLVTKLLLKRSASKSLMGSMNASLANWGNPGIPIASYVLKDPAYVAPLLVFQLGFFIPMLLVGMDATSGRHRTTPSKLLLTIIQNPVILGAVVGILMACTNIRVPGRQAASGVERFYGRG